jgi:CTP synthase
MVLLRSESELDMDIKKKIALFASLPVGAIVSAKDVDSIYKCPLWFHEQGVDDFVMEHFGIEGAPDADLAEWASIVSSADRAERVVKIALVGKYVALEDAYMSVAEALGHSGAQLGCNVEIDWVDSETLETDKQALKRLGDADGILIPGGFGGRGIEGKIRAARVAREQKIPYLGVCLGMQIAVAEFARHVAGMEGANSTEFDIETEWPVIDLLPEQKEVSDLGGTMRLGADPVKLHDGTHARKIYGEAVIYERHRHRYEVSISLRKKLEHAGLGVSGTSPDERLVELIELPDHPFFVASQFHPEFKSRPEKPSPLFYGFVEAAAARAGSESEPERAADSSAARA